jgi:hypothetical protein
VGNGEVGGGGEGIGMLRPEEASSDFERLLFHLLSGRIVALGLHGDGEVACGGEDVGMLWSEDVDGSGEH